MSVLGQEDPPEGKGGSGGGGGSTAIMSLSLYLLLLAFFILLVAISKFETEKIDQVLFSLDEAFVVEPDILMADTAVASRDGSTLAQQSFFEVVDKLFEEELAFTKVKVVREGDTMVVSVPEDAVFEDGSSELRPEAAGLIGRLSGSLKQKAEGGRYHLDMVIPMGLTADQRNTAVMRDGRFARALVAHGAPPEAISIGVRQRLRNSIHFFFALRTPQQEEQGALPGSDPDQDNPDG